VFPARQKTAVSPRATDSDYAQPASHSLSGGKKRLSKAIIARKILFYVNKNDFV
jgi:hypothetical protein